MQSIFITGSTGYIGTRLIRFLKKESGFQIRALARKSSAHKLPTGCEIVLGDALDSHSYSQSIAPAEIFIHLVGVAHPSPAKKQQFRDIDLVSVREAQSAATDAGIRHFIYISVSQFPTSIMKEYQQVRAEGEAILTASGMKCSFIRPWYVLGPGHWWPVLLKPFYALSRLSPALRQKAEQLDTVTIHQMIQTIVYAIKHPPLDMIAYYNVPDIKKISELEPA